MSQETLEWLNANTLIGYTTEKEVWASNGFVTSEGKPWWQQEGYDGAFPGAIPIDEVLNRLFYWKPLEGALTVRIPCDEAELMDGIDDKGDMYVNRIVEGKKAIIRPDTETVLGIFGESSYNMHLYDEWLVDEVAKMLDTGRGELGMSSAGLLRLGGVAYVTIELPDTITTRHGDGIRPAIVACTSLDGTKATTYVVRTMRPVCDNSLNLTLAGKQDKVKIKHSGKSAGRIGEVRDALGLIWQATEQSIAFLDACVEVPVDNPTFNLMVQALVPVPEAKMEAGKITNQRAITIADNKRGQLFSLWNGDPRVGNFTGTLAGAYHAVNTWQEHFRSNNEVQVARVIEGTLDGTFDARDAEFWNIVDALDIEVPVVAAV